MWSQPLHHLCNIPNFGPNTYRHVPIDYDDYLDVLFLYWVEYPIAYENDYLFYILIISQLLLIYIYIYDFFCWAWPLKHMIDDMFCVEREALEHLSDWLFVLSDMLWSTWVVTFVLSEKLWNTWKDNWKCWA